MYNQNVWLLLIFIGLVYGIPMKKDRLAKREVESLHFGNHQNKIPANGGMADAQLIQSYMENAKRAPVLKEDSRDEDESNEEKRSEEKLPLKKRVTPLGLDGWENQYPSYYDYYNNILNEYRSAPAISPEDNLPYVPAFRRRRASPIATAKSHRKKKSSLPSSMSHFLRRRRSTGYDYVDEATLADLLRAAAAEQLLEELEEEMDDPDYLDRFEFKYPYYPGMVDYTGEEPEDDNEQDDYSYSQDEIEGPPEEQPHWMNMSPAEMMQVRRRSEPPRKRYSFPMIPLPGQKKKRDQIDSPQWGKIEDKRTFPLKKRQQQEGELYALAQLLNESPEYNLPQLYRRDAL